MTSGRRDGHVGPFVMGVERERERAHWGDESTPIPERQEALSPLRHGLCGIAHRSSPLPPSLSHGLGVDT